MKAWWGCHSILQDEKSSTSVYIQVPGTGLRMKASLFRREMARSAPMRTVMLHLHPCLLQSGGAIGGVQPVSFP
jgi:hypothetical protein